MDHLMTYSDLTAAQSREWDALANEVLDLEREERLDSIRSAATGTNPDMHLQPMDEGRPARVTLTGAASRAAGV